MTPYFEFFCIIFLFAAIFFIDVIFRSCMFFPYIQFLHNSGITMKPLMIRWEVTRFNRQFQKLGRFKPSFLRKWFQVGAFLASISTVPVLVMLMVPAVHYLKGATVSNDSNVPFENTQTLVPLIPGVNLPFSQLFYYGTVMVICVIVHEFGHAVAASREKVAIDGCGFAFLIIFPVAFVNISREQLQHLTLWQQIRIYSAGIWHNIVLALFAFLLISANTLILAPGFRKDYGVSILHVEQSSGAALPGGFEKDDQIISIDNCEINRLNDWQKCLENIVTNPQHGYCASQHFIDLENSALGNETVANCCHNNSERLCFQFLDSKINKVMCLPGRKLAENASMCFKKEDCKSHLCLVPVPLSKSERFIKIYRRFKSPILYIGSMHELYSTVTVSPWVSKFRALSIEYVHKYETLLAFFVSLSAGLAVVNVIPCYGLDGQYLCENLVHYYLSTIFTKYSSRIMFISALKFIGTSLLIFNFCNGLTDANFSLSNKIF